MSDSSAARAAYSVFRADLGREPSADECLQWATDHRGDPDEPRALVDAGWAMVRRDGDSERALDLFRRAVGFGGEDGMDAQVGVVEQLYALQRDQEADEAQRALRAELDGWHDPRATVRIFDDMADMLGESGQPQLALDWCQAGLDKAAGVDQDPEVERLREALLMSRGFLREELGLELDNEDRATRAKSDAILAKTTAKLREQLGIRAPGQLISPRDGNAFDAVVLRWRREEFPTMRARWPEATANYGDDYNTYASRIQREAHTYEDAGATRVHLVTGSLADFEAYAKAHDRDPAESSTRQNYGEWCIKARPDRVRSWPPERNGTCWCDSGRKYKKCCGAPART